MTRATVMLLMASLALGCGARGALEPCNVATQDCQDDVFYAIMRLRGVAFDPFDGVPPIRTVTLEQYQKDLLARAKKAKPADKGDAPPKINPWDVALGLLGLIKPSTSTAEASVTDAVMNVAAFYSSDTRSVTVIDRGGSSSEYADTKLLAHELVHAFQDNESGSFGSLTTDSGFAARALVEGEATLYEELAGAEMREISPKDLDWGGYFGGWVRGLRSQLPKQESTYFAVNWFIYPLGASMLAQAYRDGGPAAVRSVISGFPSHTLDFMGLLDGFEPAATPALHCEVAAPGKRFERVGFDRFGALQLYAFLVAAGLSEKDSWKHAESWRDDLLWVYFDEKAGAVSVYWRIRLNSKSGAAQVVKGIKPTAERVLQAIGSDVLVRASNVPLLLDEGRDAVDCRN
jgi:hypothetical protein